jgi:polar amino acid transport system permease protein
MGKVCVKRPAWLVIVLLASSLLLTACSNPTGGAGAPGRSLEESAGITFAAASLGMGPLLSLWRIILPQAMRAILPGIGNDTISMIKMTSLASVIFVNELTFRSQQIVAQKLKFFTVFAAAGLIYLALTSVIALLQLAPERHFNLEIERRTAADSALARFFSFRWRPTPPQPALRASSPAVIAPSTPRPELTRLLTREAPSGPACDGERSPFVVCTNVWKVYGEREVLRGINLTVHRGEVVTIMGPSGSGKSTFLRLINHIEVLDRGEIKFDGKYLGYEKVGDVLRPIRNLAKARAGTRIGMVFQHFHLFEHLTALENIVEAPIHVYREAPTTARERDGRRNIATPGNTRPRARVHRPSPGDLPRGSALAGHRRVRYRRDRSAAGIEPERGQDSFAPCPHGVADASESAFPAGQHITQPRIRRSPRPSAAAPV